ncbi:MAG: GTPase HflX [Acidobacteria bacterium]|nr:MAG: GTPase HflX [Acidobacteriota bacterium]
MRPIRKLEGNVTGLKARQKKQLEKLYKRRLPPRELVTQEFARRLTEISREIRRQVGVLVNRKGEVEWVIVGSANQIVLPDLKRLRVAERRFRGLRCLHTHLSQEPLTRDDLTDLALLRLDAMSAIEAREDGLPGIVRTAHLTPASAGGNGSEPWELMPEVLPSQIDFDFIAFITELEEEFAEKRGEHHRFDRRERAILVGVTTGSVEEAREHLSELAELARFSDVVVLDTLVQKRAKLDRRYLLGKGKIEELVIQSLQKGADLIIFDRNLTPAQVRSIAAATDLKILDRTQLILDIFARRAQSSEGKLQVELAQLRYMLPRLTEMDTALSRLTGGIGGRGPGETKLEIDRRRARDRIARLQKSIQDIRRKRGERRKRRVGRGLPIVTLVGYTNAGKSSLLNRLTKSNVAAGSRMFETLDPTTRRLRVPVEKEVLLADTVGFIRDLPPELIEAFRATLEEIETSALILHVVDASSSESRERMDAVAKILSDLELDDIPQLVVFNKSDLLSPDERAALGSLPDSIVVSALTGDGTEAVVERVGSFVKMPAPVGYPSSS